MFYEVSKVFLLIYLDSNTIFLLMILEGQLLLYMVGILLDLWSSRYNGVVCVFTIKGWYPVGIYGQVATIELSSCVDHTDMNMCFLLVDKYYVQVNQ